MLNEVEKRRYKAITGAVMYLAQVTRYGILCGVNQLARATPKPVKTQMGRPSIAGQLPAFCLLGCQLRQRSQQRQFYVIIHRDVGNAPISFKVGLQGLTAQSTMETELVAAALTIKEALFCSNMMLDESFGRVPLYIDDALALHFAGNRTYSLRAKHIALRYLFFVQELMEEGKASTHYVKSEDQLADLDTNHLSKCRHRDLIKLTNEFRA